MYELTYLCIGLLAGVAIGVMLMALTQRHAKQREKKAVEPLENSVSGPKPPQRWNGRYPADAERRRRA